MTHVGTHPDILDIERNGMLPNPEPESQLCPACGELTFTENIQKCDNCAHEICPRCWIWIPKTGGRFCAQECLIERIGELEDELQQLEKEVK